MDMDAFTLKQWPLLMASSNGTALPVLADGVRYIAASSGLWRETKLPWLHAVLPVAVNAAARVPYGNLQPTVRFLCSFPPQRLWRDFTAYAKAQMPNECGAAMLWNPETDTWRLAIRRAIQASGDRLDYEEVDLEGPEILVVDVHSHGVFPSMFSDVDDVDDAGSMKLAAVIGQLDATMDMAVRLSVVDTFLQVNIKSDASWEAVLC